MDRKDCEMKTLKIKLKILETPVKSFFEDNEEWIKSSKACELLNISSSNEISGSDHLFRYIFCFIENPKGRNGGKLRYYSKNDIDSFLDNPRDIDRNKYLTSREVEKEIGLEWTGDGHSSITTYLSQRPKLYETLDAEMREVVDNVIQVTGRGDRRIKNYWRKEDINKIREYFVSRANQISSMKIKLNKNVDDELQMVIDENSELRKRITIIENILNKYNLK